tara:strand:+ start:308 stop:643 length:336 start_codon:yes stop_codon:yes gene_type:complete
MASKTPDDRKKTIGDYIYDEERWLNKQQLVGDCLLWTGPLHRQGYGFINGWKTTGDSCNITTHRLAMMIELGRNLDRKEFVIHKCANPNCVNPLHLTVGDYTSKKQNNGRT